jgi:DNA polymerase alpha subunit B
MAKFSYKTMSMKLSEASEYLDDRIEEFTSLIKAHHQLDDAAFGDPTARSPDETIAVGRIASDSGEPGRLNEGSLVLELSRAVANGKRVPLRAAALPDFQFFPGKIVALRGVNATGDFFAATASLAPPPLLPGASDVAALDAHNARASESGDARRPLVVLVAAGPYTRDDDLDFAPLHALLAAADAQRADALLLSGPFVDAEHPLVRAGDLDLPPSSPVPPDRATVADLFRACVSAPLTSLAASLPACAVALCPSSRDAVARHVAWPQDKLVPRRADLALPRTVNLVTNPMLLSLNEAHVAVSNLDALQQIGATEAVARSVRMRGGEFLERLARQLLEQRHLFPVFPPADRMPAVDDEEELPAGPIGSCLDVAYLKLGELKVKPDVLVTPSMLPPFVKVRRPRTVDMADLAGR